VPNDNEDVFLSASAVRLSLDDISRSREVVLHVDVRKPNRAEYVRVHPDPAMSVVTSIYTDPIEGEIFLVHPAMRDELRGDWRPATLMVARTWPGGSLLLWPVPMPDGDPQKDKCGESHRAAAALAQSKWVRMQWVKGTKTYSARESEGVIAEPTWPRETFDQLLQVGFRGRIIDSPSHPAARTIRGLP
jgi:hypothetical protein